MTTRRTFLATAAAAAVCPLPARAEMLTVPVDVPVGDLVWVVLTELYYDNKVFWMTDQDVMSWEPADELPFVSLPVTDTPA